MTPPARAQLTDERRRRLEEYLRGERHTRPEEESFAIERRPPGTAVALSLAQEQVWVHAQMAPGIPIYNEPVTVHRHGPLDRAVLERCLLEILRRHEAWRTTFSWAGEEPAQVVHDAPTGMRLGYVDLSALPEAEREEEALILAARDAREPFDLERGPLWRARLVRMADDEHRLSMTIHQLILDGVTAYQVFLPELAALYEAFSHGDPSPLPELPVQYGDWAIWQRRRLEEGHMEDQIAYWRDRFRKPSEPVAWPNDRPRPTVQTHRGVTETLTIPNAVVAPARALSGREGVTLYMVLLAGFVTLLRHHTDQDDLVLGTVGAGRSRPEVRGLLGCFLNPLALRVDTSGDPPFRVLLGRVREEVLAALTHQDVPFGRVVEEVRTGRPDAGRNPLFQIIVSVEPPPPRMDSGWSLTQFDVSSGASKLDLYVNLEDRPEGLTGPITYNPDLFDTSTIERMVGDWQGVLMRAVREPDRRLSELGPQPAERAG